MCLMVIKWTILESLRDMVAEEEIEAKFFNKLRRGITHRIELCMNCLTTIHYKRKGNIKEYTAKMSHIHFKTNVLNL